jgi:hypothetical protein
MNHPAKSGEIDAVAAGMSNGLAKGKRLEDIQATFQARVGADPTASP